MTTFFLFLLRNIQKYHIIGAIIDLTIFWFIAFALYFIKYMIFDYKKAQKAGDEYESLIAKLISKKIHITPFRNILLVEGEDETEVDMAFVCKKGIFAIECKFRSKKHKPKLTGSLNDKVWGVTNSTTMQNPFDQNYKHIKFMEHILEVDVVNSVVYTSCPFSFRYFGMDRESKKCPIFELLQKEHIAIVYDNKGANHKGTTLFASALEEMPDIYTDEQVDRIAEQLKSMQMNKKERKEFAIRMMAKQIEMEKELNKKRK